MRTTFDTHNYACEYCGFTPAHLPTQCSMVKAIEYYPNGTIKRIEKRDPLVYDLPSNEVKIRPQP